MSTVGPQTLSIDLDKYAHLIESERVRVQYRNLPAVLAGTLFAAAIAAVTLAGSLPGWRTGLWLSIMLAGVLGRWWFLLRPYRQHPDTSLDAPAALRRICAGALAGGCAWGAAGVLLFVPGNVMLQAWLAILLGAMGISSIPAYGAHLKVVMAYLLPSIAPYVIVLLLADLPLSTSFGWGLVLYLAAVIYFAKNFTHVLLESLTLRFENLDLLGELRVQKAAADSANLAKSRFLAAASHDLRQPMHAMSFYIAALRQKPLRADEQSIAQSLQRCTDAMQGMCGALLDISRLDAGIVNPQISAFPLNDMMQRIRAEFEPQAREKCLRLRIRPTKLIAQTDELLLERVLSNLVSNAVQHTDRGGVLVACRSYGPFVRLVVYDTGRGIPKDKHQLVFEEFYQIGNPERDRANGLGLGLAVVDRLVKLLDLPLTLKSTVGKGTAFTLDVLRATSADDVIRPAGCGLSGALALVVDNEADVLNATRVLLQSWNMVVTTATCGAEAMARVASLTRCPDILLCDYRLRGEEDVLKVIESIRSEFNHDIPAILITGDTAVARLRNARASGLMLLHKPVDAARLRAALAEALAERRAEP